MQKCQNMLWNKRPERVQHVSWLQFLIKHVYLCYGLCKTNLYQLIIIIISFKLSNINVVIILNSPVSVRLSETWSLKAADSAAADGFAQRVQNRRILKDNQVFGGSDEVTGSL